MSKKDRLKAQAARQQQERLALEEQEREEREAARSRQSRSAKKMLKKAKHGRYGKEPLGFFLLKLLMLLPFGYSGVYYGLIQIFGMVFGYIEPAPPTWVFWFTLVGDLIVLSGIVLEFFKKHIPSFIIIGVGTGLYLRAAKYFIDYIQERLENDFVEERLREMDREYMMHLYPMAAAAVLSLIILLWWIALKLIAARRAKHLRDTAPVQSIVNE